MIEDKPSDVTGQGTGGSIAGGRGSPCPSAGRKAQRGRSVCHHRLQRNVTPSGDARSPQPSVWGSHLTSGNSKGSQNFQEKKNTSHFKYLSLLQELRGDGLPDTWTAELGGMLCTQQQGNFSKSFRFLGFSPVVGGPSGCHSLESSLPGTAFPADAQPRALGASPQLLSLTWAQADPQGGFRDPIFHVASLWPSAKITLDLMSIKPSQNKLKKKGGGVISL